MILSNQGTIRVDSEVGKGTTSPSCSALPTKRFARTGRRWSHPDRSSDAHEQRRILDAADRGPYRLLIVEDEPLMRSIIVQLARSEGYEVFEAPSAEVALGIFEKEKIDLAILDLNLTSGGSGLDLLRKMRELDPEVMGIIVTAYASVESAVEALHQGAYDYITKPFANDHLKNGGAQRARSQGAVQRKPLSAPGAARKISLRKYHRQRRRDRAQFSA